MNCCCGYIVVSFSTLKNSRVLIVPLKDNFISTNEDLYNFLSQTSIYEIEYCDFYSPGNLIFYLYPNDYGFNGLREENIYRGHVRFSTYEKPVSYQRKFKKMSYWYLLED